LVEGSSGHVLDGNGPSWWDGQGSNGGISKYVTSPLRSLKLTVRPNHFISLKKMTGDSVVRNLNIINYPVHCFYVSGAKGLLMENILLNNTLGDMPNKASEGRPAGHNTDGFGFASSDNVVLRNSRVWNQDDCVAITSGTNITVYGMYCHGGHGLSIGVATLRVYDSCSNIIIGSVGGKSSTNTATP
jgi:polygalacturonase